MAKGGTFGPHKIRHFNGHLFEEATVFELTEQEIGKLAVAGEADWQFIQPSIMGNLFERGLDPDHRAQLGAHYTSEEDIKTLVEPVLMAPLRREWSTIKVELAQVSVQIGYLKWRRDNGFPNERDPVLQELDHFQNEDALLVPHFRSKAKTLKEAQAGEHAADDALKFYTERKWPTCDVIVSNPPFLGDKLMRSEMGDDYVKELRRTYGDRLPGQSDLCCYWFEKARDSIEHKHCKRAGLLATQGIRGGANREVLKRIKQTGDIFFAISDSEWILDGANVHVSMIGFDDGSDNVRMLDSKLVLRTNANLTAEADISSAARIKANAEIGFIGVSMHGHFDIDEAKAIEFCTAGGNPTGYANSDVVRPILNAFEITKRAEPRWIIAFDPDSTAQASALYEMPFGYVEKHVRPVRAENKRKIYRERWWVHGEARPAMLQSLRPLPRFLATPRVSKHRVFVWISPEYLPSDATVAFARDDDYFFGVLHSRFHEVWALKLGTRLETRPRYTPTTCFETFPLPEATTEQKIDISAAAKELNELRENWLNPPEWTTTRVLEFAGSIDGPWSRFVVGPDTRSMGIVRYPRAEARDEECAKKLAKRTLTNLYNERPAWLMNAHAKLDAAVAAAYGFAADLKDEQILEKLLALNTERANKERKSASKQATRKASRLKSEHEMI